MNGGLRLPFTVYRADKCSIINAQGSMNSQCINTQRFGPLNIDGQWFNGETIRCKIRMISWHSFCKLYSSGSSVNSSHSLSQYSVSEASFLQINTLLRKSFLELAFLASTKLAPTLLEERTS